MTNAERRARYNEYQWLRERGRLPIAQAKKIRRRKGRDVEQDLSGSPRSPVPTEEEDRLAEILSWRGIKFERQYCIRLARKRKKGGTLFAFVDFWLPDAALVVEVDGWQHSHPKVKAEDRIRAIRIQNAVPSIGGIFRIWNTEVTQGSERLKELVALAIAARP